MQDSSSTTPTASVPVNSATTPKTASAKNATAIASPAAGTATTVLPVAMGRAWIRGRRLVCRRVAVLRLSSMIRVLRIVILVRGSVRRARILRVVRSVRRGIS